MTDNTQPEALDLADWLEAVGGGPSAKRCAALLREQHARIAEMEAQLASIGAGGVSGPLMGRASLAASAGSEPVAWLVTAGKVFVDSAHTSLRSAQAAVERSTGAIITPLYTHPSPPEGAGWISVDERLPGEQGQDSEQVLVFINGHCELTDMECRRGGAWGLRLGYFDAERQAFRVHGRPEYHVTHWRPEPAPPASEAKGA